MNLNFQKIIPLDKIIKIILLLIISVCNSSYAQIPPGYYNSAQGLTGNNLKIALHNIIDNHIQLSYNDLWDAYKKTDKKPNGKVCDIYSDVANGTPPYEFTFGSDQCGSYNSEGDCYNREHSWPQSWFNSVDGPQTDLFQVYPTDGKVNGQRGNYPYGNVSSSNWISLNGSKLGLSADGGYNAIVFEPVDEFKGDLARTYFYMSTRYYSEDGAWSSSDASNKSDILPWQVNVLLQWHHQDPVSSKEIARNDSIYYLFQNNRNPFIDNPQWADSIWQFTDFTSIVAITNTPFVLVYPVPANDILLLGDNSTYLPVTYQIFNSLGHLVFSGFTDNSKIEIAGLQDGIYFIRFRTSLQVLNSKFIKQ